MKDEPIWAYWIITDGNKRICVQTTIFPENEYLYHPFNKYYKKIIYKGHHTPILRDPFTVVLGDEVIFELKDPKWIAIATAILLE